MFVILLLINLTKTNPSKKIDLSIYYESQCPDSKSFIIDQLLPTLGILQDYIDLKLIPFGKAHSIDDNHFECQHGPTECAGNMVQSCTIDEMYGRTSDVGIVRYVACEMETEAGTRGDLTCVQEAGVNTNAVYDCVRSTKGIELQLQNEYLTNLIRPKFIPTITIGGVSINYLLHPAGRQRENSFLCLG